MPSPVKSGVYAEYLTRQALRKFEREHSNFYWQRMADTRLFQKAVNPNIIQDIQPADYLAIYRGKVYFIEVKSTKAPRFYFRYIREHQIYLGEKIVNAGGKYHFLIYHRKRPKSDAYHLTLQEVVDMINSGVRGFKFSDFESHKLERDGAIVCLDRIFR